jgi:hypothetical protein
MDKLKKTNSIGMKAILQGWNFMRILRFVLGIAIIVQGIVSKETMTTVLGVVFGGMALANIGCCGMGGCAVNRTPTSNKQEEVQYEEVVTNK